MKLLSVKDIGMPLTRCLARATVVLSVTIQSLAGAQSPQEALPSFEPLQQGIVLGRPTDHSVIAHIVAGDPMDFFLRYGPDPNHLDEETVPHAAQQGERLRVDLDGLEPDTRYYYKLLKSPPDANQYTASDLFTFHTQRAPGTSFTFVVQADSHLDEQSIPQLYEITLANALADRPDFMIDLGDTSMTDKLPDKSHDQIEQRYLLQRSYFSLLCHSCALYLVLGNHDGEAGWAWNGKPDSWSAWSTLLRKHYFENPEPDDFYTGSQHEDPVLGRRQNYYAWHWGNALFVVLDPYAYTQRKPGKNNGSWDFTLGETQYRWFEQTLARSSAHFKFVFCHQIIGGDSQGRGGIEYVPYYEMGGHNTDGTWGFDRYRPGWDKPIHELMVEHKVAIFFHGHDHFFAKQELDGVVYQLAPQPSHHNYKRAGQAADYGYSNGEVLPNSGHLRVQVSETETTVDYVRAYLPENENNNRVNGMVDYTYTLSRPGSLSP